MNLLTSVKRHPRARGGTLSVTEEKKKKKEKEKKKDWSWSILGS